MLKDNLLTTKNKEPMVLSGSAGVVMHIIRLLILVPGENQSHPDMGVGIISRCRHRFYDDLSELENEIADQIDTYLPMLKDVKVTLSYADTVLHIEIFASNSLIRLNLRDNMLSLIDVT